jgi:hypothetical protein
MFNKLRSRWALRQNRILKEAEEAEERKAIEEESKKNGSQVKETKSATPTKGEKKAAKKDDKKATSSKKEVKSVTPAKAASKKGDSKKEEKSRPATGTLATSVDRAWFFIERHLYAIEYDYWTQAMDRSTVIHQIVTMRNTERTKQLEAKVKDNLIKPMFTQWNAWQAYGIREELKPLIPSNEDEFNQMKVNLYMTYWTAGADIHARLWSLILPPLTSLLQKVNAALVRSNGLFKDKPKGGWKDQLKEQPLQSIHYPGIPTWFSTIVNHLTSAEGQCRVLTPESISRKKEIEKRRDDLFVFFMSNYFGFRFDSYDTTLNASTLTLLEGFFGRMTPEQIRDNILTHYEGEDLLEAEAATVLRLANSLSMQERLRIFGSYTMAQVIQLTMNNESWLKQWIQLQVGPLSGYRQFPLREREKILASIHVVVSALLLEETLAETTKDWLKEYQDVSVPQVRATLHKETDSKVLAERQAGMTTLWRATVTSWSPVQMRRTLTHFRKKVRNDSVENRQWMVQLILSGNQLEPFLFDADDAVRKEVQSLLLGMLDDALESGDLDSQGTVTDDSSHFILQHFIRLSRSSFTQDWDQSSYLRRQKNEREMKAKARFEAKIEQRAEGKKRPMSQAEQKVAESNAKKAAVKAAEQAKKEAAAGGKKVEPSKETETKAEKGPTQGAGSAAGKDDQEPIPDYTLLEFATEIQWRIKLFRKGEKTAAEQFRINWSWSAGACRPGQETAFIDVYLNAYKSRVLDRFPEFMVTSESQASYLEPLFNYFGRLFYRIPVLQAHLEKLLADMKSTAPRDHDNLLIINMSHPCVSRFNSILSQSNVSINVHSPGAADSFLRPKPARPKAIKDAKKKAELIKAAGGIVAGVQKGRKGAKKAKGKAKKAGRTPKPKQPVRRPAPPPRRPVLKWDEDEVGGDDNEEEDKDSIAARQAEAEEDFKRREYEIELAVEARKKWYQRPVLMDFLNTMLRSRQARRVLWTWVNVQRDLHMTDGENRTEKRVLDQIVRELLTITPSAIYIRFVWRHLLRHRQELLTPFLNAKQTFRGAFYLPPNHRGPFSIVTNRRNWWNALTPPENIEAFVKTEVDLEAKIDEERKRYEANTSKRSEMIAKLVADKQVAEKIAEEKRIQDEKDAKANAKQFAEDQAKAKAEGKELKAPVVPGAKKIKYNKKGKPMPPKKKKVKAGPKKLKTSTEIATAASRLTGFDTAEYFHLEASYGLHRLRPDQLESLAAQRQLQIINVDRPIPERTESLRRWTLLPWVQYADIVEFLDLHEAIDPLKPKDKGMPINLIETGMRGCMYNDEVVAPLSYLLSPELLGSDRARVAIFSVSKSLPYIPGNKFSQLMRALLSGERRHAMKVTAYKQVIRMLASKPTNENIEMIVFEWKRKELHRDVRLAILKAALEFAKKPAFVDLAWAILESAPLCPDQEILIALCAIVPEGSANITPAAYKQLVELPRIEEKLTDFMTMRIPTAQASRYVLKVVIPLARDCPDKDIRALAMGKISAWTVYEPQEVPKLSMPIYAKFMIDDTPESLDNPQPSTQQMYNHRYSVALQGAFDCSNIQQVSAAGARPKECRPQLVKAIESMCQSWLTFPDPELRITMYSRINQYVNGLPAGIRTYPEYLTYTLKDEDYFMEPIKRLLGPLAFTITYAREISFMVVDQPAYNSNAYHELGDLVPRASALAHKGLQRLATCPYDRAFVIQQVNRIFGRMSAYVTSDYTGSRRWSRTAVGGLLRNIITRQVGANNAGNLGPQYVDACRTISVALIHTNPWFIQADDANIQIIADFVQDLAGAIAEDQMTNDNLVTLRGVLQSLLPQRDRHGNLTLSTDHPMCPIFPTCTNIMRVLAVRFLSTMGTNFEEIPLVATPTQQSGFINAMKKVATAVKEVVKGKGRSPRNSISGGNNESKTRFLGGVNEFSSPATERVANQIFGQTVLTLINASPAMWLEALPPNVVGSIVPTLVRHLAAVSPLARAQQAAGGANDTALPLYPVDTWANDALSHLRKLVNFFLTTRQYANDVYNYNQRPQPTYSGALQNPHHKLEIDLVKPNQLLAGFLYEGDESKGQLVFSSAAAPNPSGGAAPVIDEFTKAHRTLRIEAALLVLLDNSEAAADVLAWKYRECKGGERRQAVEGLCRLVDEMLSYAMRSRADEASYLAGSFSANSEAVTVGRINKAITTMVSTFGSSRYLSRDGNFATMVGEAVPTVTLTRQTVDALRYAIGLARSVRAFPLPKGGKEKEQADLAARASQLIHEAILHVVEIPADLATVTTEAIALINRLLPSDASGDRSTFFQNVRSIIITNLARRTLISEATAAQSQCTDASYISTCRSLTRDLLSTHRWFLFNYPANLGTILAFINDHIDAVVRSELDFGVVTTQLNGMLTAYFRDNTWATGASYSGPDQILKPQSIELMTQLVGRWVVIANQSARDATPATAANNQIYGKIIFRLMQEQTTLFSRTLPVPLLNSIVSALLRHMASISPAVRATGAAVPLPLLVIDHWTSTLATAREFIESIFATRLAHAQAIFNFNRINLASNTHYDAPIDLKQATDIAFSFLYIDANSKDARPYFAVDAQGNTAGTSNEKKAAEKSSGSTKGGKATESKAATPTAAGDVNADALIENYLQGLRVNVAIQLFISQAPGIAKCFDRLIPEQKLGENTKLHENTTKLCSLIDDAIAYTLTVRGDTVDRSLPAGLPNWGRPNVVLPAIVTLVSSFTMARRMNRDWEVYTSAELAYARKNYTPLRVLNGTFVRTDPSSTQVIRHVLRPLLVPTPPTTLGDVTAQATLWTAIQLASSHSELSVFAVRQNRGAWQPAPKPIILPPKPRQAVVNGRSTTIQDDTRVPKPLPVFVWEPDRIRDDEKVSPLTPFFHSIVHVYALLQPRATTGTTVAVPPSSDGLPGAVPFATLIANLFVIASPFLWRRDEPYAHEEDDEKALSSDLSAWNYLPQDTVRFIQSLFAPIIAYNESQSGAVATKFAYMNAKLIEDFPRQVAMAYTGDRTPVASIASKLLLHMSTHLPEYLWTSENGIVRSLYGLVDATVTSQPLALRMYGKRSGTLLSIDASARQLIARIVSPLAQLSQAQAAPATQSGVLAWRLNNSLAIDYLQMNKEWVYSSIGTTDAMPRILQGIMLAYSVPDALTASHNESPNAYIINLWNYAQPIDAKTQTKPLDYGLRWLDVRQKHLLMALYTANSALPSCPWDREFKVEVKANIDANKKATAPASPAKSPAKAKKGKGKDEPSAAAIAAAERLEAKARGEEKEVIPDLPVVPDVTPSPMSPLLTTMASRSKYEDIEFAIQRTMVSQVPCILAHTPSRVSFIIRCGLLAIRRPPMAATVKQTLIDLLRETVSNDNTVPLGPGVVREVVAAGTSTEVIAASIAAEGKDGGGFYSACINGWLAGVALEVLTFFANRSKVQDKEAPIRKQWQWEPVFTDLLTQFQRHDDPAVRLASLNTVTRTEKRE